MLRSLVGSDMCIRDSIEGTYYDMEVDDKGNYIAHICGYQWVLAPVDTESVSYTHLTLPTIYSV